MEDDAIEISFDDDLHWWRCLLLPLRNLVLCLFSWIRSEEWHRVVSEWAWPHDYFRVCGRGHTPSPAYVGVPTRLQFSIYQRWVGAVNAKNNIKKRACR